MNRARARRITEYLAIAIQFTASAGFLVAIAVGALKTWGYVAIAALLIPLAITVRLARGSFRLQEAARRCQCPECQYQLDRTRETQRCPECGNEWTLEQIRNGGTDG